MISKNHPRAISLKTRKRIEQGVKNSIASYGGLIAHGRGEAFDYLIGEESHDFAFSAIEVTATILLLAKNPVLSINGNVAALVSNEFITLSNVLNCPIEVNIFHFSKRRKEKIRKHLISHGAQNVVGVIDATRELPGISSERRFVSSNGIYKADVVFVPLEDGDRCEALVKSGKRVIVIDLNPLSRTAQNATVTIVDNVVRALPILIKQIKELKDEKEDKLEDIIKQYDNKQILRESMEYINKRLMKIARKKIIL